MIIGVTELREQLGDVLNRVHYGQNAAVITKRGEPFVVIVPIVGVLNEHTNIQSLITALVSSANKQKDAEADDQSGLAPNARPSMIEM